jgi:hypothetical protein
VGQQPIGPGVTKREYRKPETREWDGGLRDGRRYQVAGWVLQGFAQSGVVTTFASDVTADRRVVERAVQLADLLLKRLEEP